MKTRERLNGISTNFEASLKCFRTLQFYLKADKNKRRFTHETSVHVHEFLCPPRTLIIKYSSTEKIFLAKAVDKFKNIFQSQDVFRVKSFGFRNV